MSPVGQHAELSSLRRSEPETQSSAPSSLPSACLTPARDPKGACGQLFSSSAHSNLSSCSLGNLEEGSDSLPCSLALWGPRPSKTLKTKQFKSGQKEKEKSTNDRGCSVGTTATGMPDPPLMEPALHHCPAAGAPPRNGLCSPHISQRHSVHAQALCLA